MSGGRQSSRHSPVISKLNLVGACVTTLDRTNTGQLPAETQSVRGGFVSRLRNVKKTYNK